MTNIQIGQPVESLEDFNTLPIGAVLTDRQNWVHTKIEDGISRGFDAPDTAGNQTTTATLNGDDVGTFGNCWQWGAVLTSLPGAETPEAPERPLVDFSGPSRLTARTYAHEAVSKVLKPESNTILKQAAAGEKVDAYALNAAVTDAMRSATTRNGQSMGRRRQAEKFAHLGHIVQAVLENHADSLPAYPEGERSRVAFDAKRALAEAKAEVDRLTGALLNEQNLVAEQRAERATLVEAASAERRRLVAEIGENHAQAVAEGATLQAKIEEAEAQADEICEVFGYAFVLLDADQQQRVLGFWDAVAK
jgi:cell division septum initiation protein DivIVA